MELFIPRYVENILYRLEKFGYEAFIVGGSVRDLILGKEPADFDITTNAKPEEIEEIFKEYKTILVGKEYGTVVVVQDEGNIEVTTYRLEAEYLDGRKPSKVYFSDEIEEDLSRRDFTINAMAYNKSKGLIDLFSGQKDLENKLIKTVGNPIERFEEDHLRILRAIRFATQLGFYIEEETKNSCTQMGYLLKKISAERIREELFKILLSDRPSYGIRLMEDLDILEIIIPELKETVGFDQKNPHHEKDVFEHILCVVDHTPPVLEIRLAALFHDIGKPHTLTIDEEGIGHFYGHDKLGVKMSRDILKRLRCPNEMIDDVANLIKEHMTHHADLKDKGLKRLISRVGKDKIFHLIELQKADKKCSNRNVDIGFLFERERQIQRILDRNEPYEKKQLEISGYDIINLGYKEGKIVGEILDYLMERVIDEPNLNHRDILIDMVWNKFTDKAK